MPAGIGIAPPQRRQLAFVVGGRCRYQMHTTAPTGVIEVAPRRSGPPPVLGELFTLWGQPLSRRRLASFSGRVLAFVNGRRWDGDPAAVPLSRHAQIVLEVGPPVRPHASYLFPPGL